MLDFIIKYWVEELFGLIIIIAGIVGKKLWTRYKNGRELEEQEKLDQHDQKILNKINSLCEAVTTRIDDLEKRIDQRIEDLEERLDEKNKSQDEKIENLISGVLSLQKKQLLTEGVRLLQPDHVITYEEYMAYNQQHIAYNRLGGNSEGDEQFGLVTAKFKSGLKQ